MKTKNYANKLLLFHVNNTQSSVLIINILFLIFINSMGLFFGNLVYCTNESDTFINPSVNAEIGEPTTDLPIRDETFYKQFGPVPIYNKNAFWGHGSPYNMEQVYEENSGYSTWTHRDCSQSTSLLSEGPLSEESDSGNETAEDAAYNLHFTGEDMVDSLVDQIKVELMKIPPAVSELCLRDIVHNTVINDMNRPFWMCCNEEMYEDIEALHNAMVLNIQSRLAEDPDAYLLHHIGASILIDADLMVGIIPNEDNIVQNNSLYSVYYHRVYTPNTESGSESESV